jgi:hypothetical protein
MLLVPALCLCSATANADLLYQFDVNASGVVDAFSFSFTVPSFVTAGQSPAFTPFHVTDGTHSWTMVNDLAGSIGGGSIGCFAFDTGGTSFSDFCGAGAFSAPDGAFYLQFNSGLPTATGTDNISTGGGPLDFSGGQDRLVASGTLTITSTSTSVPEPASIGLLGLAVAALGWKRRKRPV